MSETRYLDAGPEVIELAKTRLAAYLAAGIKPDPALVALVEAAKANAEADRQLGSA
ncbi:hypothetical protein GTQ99_00270 [Kineococcus sp. T13]|uniref:hypothetical protein n=1 Tax=Kineococcus vitellinus TaxID=2696565 RepID=UPI00141362F7|nr:hypothetical protein [Kineococcus vitellinus]NAZ73865.1 hypothetical protein [Kineococcus vitellinus]